MATILKNQTDIHSYGLSKLKDLPTAYFQNKPTLLDHAQTDTDALYILASVFDVTPEKPKIIFKAFELEINIDINFLYHIIEKRNNGRERFALFAKQTLLDPHEVWLVEYDDGSFRYIYLALFSDSKYHIAVIINITPDGSILWNYMNSEFRSLEKLRVGKLLHCKNKK